MIWLLFALASAGFAANVAACKGWRFTPWLVGGLLFGPLAVLAAAGMPLRMDAEKDPRTGAIHSDSA